MVVNHQFISYPPPKSPALGRGLGRLWLQIIFRVCEEVMLCYASFYAKPSLAGGLSFFCRRVEMAFGLCPEWHTMAAHSKGLLNDKSTFLFNVILCHSASETTVAISHLPSLAFNRQENGIKWHSDYALNGTQWQRSLRLLNGKSAFLFNVIPCHSASETSDCHSLSFNAILGAHLTNHNGTRTGLERRQKPRADRRQVCRGATS